MPGPYPFAGVIVIDPATNAPAPGGTVRLYDPTDIAFVTPQEITDAYGADLEAVLTAGAGGWSGKFNHASLAILNAKGGEPGDLTQPVFELVSGAGVIEMATAAAASAAAAQVAAEAAAVSAAAALAPVDAVVAGLITDGDSATHAAGLAVFGTGGTGTDPDAVHITGAETIAGIKTFTDAPVVPGGAYPIAATAGLQTALDAKADASDLATTDAALEGKVTATPYNAFDMTFVPTGGTLPVDFGVGLVLYEIP